MLSFGFDEEVTLTNKFLDYVKTKVEPHLGKEVVLIKDFRPDVPPAEITEIVRLICTDFPEKTAANLFAIVVGSGPKDMNILNRPFTDHCAANVRVSPKEPSPDFVVDPQSPFALGCRDNSEIPTIYIFSDVAETGKRESPQERELFQFLIDKMIFGVTDHFREPCLEDLLVGVDEHVRILTDKTEQQVSRAKADMESVKTSLIAAIRKWKEASILLGDPNNLRDKIVTQFKHILNMPEIRSASIRNGLLVVVPKDPIHIHEPRSGVTYDIGHITMEINLDSGRVVFRNSTRLIGSKNHPHQSGDTMCLGEITEYVPEMIAENELAGLTKLLLNYAKSVNMSDSAGATIVKWPKVKS